MLELPGSYLNLNNRRKGSLSVKQKVVAFLPFWFTDRKSRSKFPVERFLLFFAIYSSGGATVWISGKKQQFTNRLFIQKGLNSNRQDQWYDALFQEEQHHSSFTYQFLITSYQEKWQIGLFKAVEQNIVQLSLTAQFDSDEVLDAQILQEDARGRRRFKQEGDFCIQLSVEGGKVKVGGLLVEKCSVPIVVCKTKTCIRSL